MLTVLIEIGRINHASGFTATFVTAVLISRKNLHLVCQRNANIQGIGSPEKSGHNILFEIN